MVLSAGQPVSTALAGRYIMGHVLQLALVVFLTDVSTQFESLR